MKSEHQPLLNAIEGEFIQLRYRWALFCQLFDSGQDNVDLLNKSGSNVFQLLQKLIIDDAMMTLCRLSDPEKSMGHENASIRNLFKKLKDNLSGETARKIDAKLLELDAHMKNISTLRNKAISHKDLNHALAVELLPRPAYDELEKSIETVKSILNALTSELLNYTGNYVVVMPVGRDGNKLLHVLGKTHEFKKMSGRTHR